MKTESNGAERETKSHGHAAEGKAEHGHKAGHAKPEAKKHKAPHKEEAHVAKHGLPSTSEAAAPFRGARSETKHGLPSSQERGGHALPRRDSDAEQAVVNIGMIGHVDHGKCIALDSAILLNSELSDGAKLLEQASLSGAPRRLSESEALFESTTLKAFSLSPGFELISVPARLFVQNYSGKMVEIETKRGKKITVSPRHPLLVNDGRDLTWVEGKKLCVGEAIAALRNIPDQEFVRDFSGDWKEKLAKSCWTVTREDFAQLRRKTHAFTRFDGLSLEEINKLRMLSGNSFAQLERKSGCFGGEIATAFKKGRFTEKQGKAVTGALENLKFEEPAWIVINYKANTKSFCKVNVHDHFGDDVLKFLAFVIAEGCLHNGSVRFSQEDNGMLGEMKGLCVKLFSEEPRFYSPFDYQINNKALACFLEARYAVLHGNSRQSGIPAWVFSLPKGRLAVFLNWFFSLEGNFNPKSGQVALAQANKNSILVVSYALKKFGIAHSIHNIEKCATNTEKKTRRTYWQLLVSGTENIRKFAQEIGVSLPKKAGALEEMGGKSQNGKQSDEMVPLDFGLLSELVTLLGWKKKKYSVRTTKMRDREWFFAYNDCSHKNCVSRKNLGILISRAKERISHLESLNIGSRRTKHAMAEAGISQKELSEKTGITQKALYTMLKRHNNGEMAKVATAIKRIAENRAQGAQAVLGKIICNSPPNIEWDRIKSVRKIDYRGPIIDLQVPGYHNFVAGMGGLVSHNTSLVKTLTGKWADTHSEEIKQGISIRIGYADTTFYKCDLAKGSEGYNSKGECSPGMGRAVPLRRVSFVDAPGHETLMATMLSGAALMDGAVLVIAANEKCPQPSTAEHLMALGIGGVKNVVVAQNKIDLVDAKRAKESYMEIAAFLKQYGYGNSPIIPIAANLNLNIDLLIEAIEHQIPTPKRDSSKELRMFVVRSFDVNKPGAKPSEIMGGVIGGSIISGALKAGDKIEISPGIEGVPVETTVLSLGVEGGRLEEVHAGGLIAVGTALDPFFTKNDEMRGQVVAKHGAMPKPVTNVRLEVKAIERLVGEKGTELKANDFVVLAVATSTVVGQVVRQSGKGEFEIALRGPAVIEKGQKVAISKREASGWRLRAYGVCK